MNTEKDKQSGVGWGSLLLAAGMGAAAASAVFLMGKNTEEPQQEVPRRRQQADCRPQPQAEHRQRQDAEDRQQREAQRTQQQEGERRQARYKQKINGEECAVCLEEFTPVSRLPCGHAFHSHCVDPWLAKSENVCPSCGHT